MTSGGTSDSYGRAGLQKLEQRMMLSADLFPSVEHIIIDNAADGAFSVFAVDIDGDGDMDVLSASLGDDKIVWYENTDGQGSFGPQQVITTLTGNPVSVFAADIDGDGDVDVLSASVGDDKIAWYENTDGLGGFGPQQVITTLADGARSIFAADLDGDGDVDVLSASFADDTIAWYENTDGLGGFGPAQVITIMADSARSVFAADIDGDGDMDVLSASFIDNTIAWYENTDGLGGFGPEQVITTSADWATSVFAADLDGDGDQDVISTSAGDDKIAWYENTDGLGGFGPEQIITTSADGVEAVFAVDIDGDGDKDILSASAGDNKIAWYENIDGLGGFGPQQVITTSANGAVSVFAADIDGDGDQDVLSASYNDDKIAWYRNASASSSPGDLNGDGLFTGDDIDLLSRAIRGDDAPGPEHDLNGDSLVNWDDHSYLITTIINTGFGDADMDWDVDVDDLNQWKANRFTTGHTVVGNGWSQGDWDGDGDVDVDDLNRWKANRFTSYPGPAGATVSDGDGLTTKPTSDTSAADSMDLWKANRFQAGTTPAGGDFDGDGDTDVDDLNIWKVNRFTAYDSIEPLA